MGNDSNQGSSGLMLIFRTDASINTGFGHLKRSVYLASLLKKKIDILFCVNNDKVLSRFLENQNIPYCFWTELINLKEKPIKSIIFDIREFSSSDIEFINWAKGNNIHTVQVTDLGLSQQPVEFTIDASIEQLFPYDENKQVLKGPDYALLHHKFRHFNKVRRKYRKKIKNIFISLGGTVQYRQLKKMVDLLNRHRYNIKVSPGFYLKKAGRKALKRRYPRIGFVGKTDNLARSLFEADVALITSGMAAAEAAAVGTPALYFYHHNEQKFVADTFEKHGAGSEISNIDDVIKFGENIIETLNSLTVEKRIEIGNKGKKLVDGSGACRIVGFFECKGII